MDKALARRLSAYRPTSATIELIKKTPIVLLVGPSGAGKDALKDRLLATGRYHHIVSHTTRHPRVNQGIPEQDGHEYHFIDETAAKKMLDEDAFIEAKAYAGNLYGTTAAEIQAAHDEGKIAMTDIEVQGVAEYKALDPSVVAIFLLPPDFNTWQARLHNRYGKVINAADTCRRLQTALEEIEQLLSTDYYVALINDNLDATFEQVQSIGQAKPPIKVNDAAARDVAKNLARDIQKYLTQNS